jgi:predicted DNA-binding protein (MmcQ/YjbR family)
MEIEEMQSICRNLPGVTEDIKWENHLCFNIGGKMFFVLGLDMSPTTSSFKANEEEFEELSSKEGCMPAPYMARYKWIHVDDLNRFGKKDWERLINESYELVSAKLPKKTKKELGLLP